MTKEVILTGLRSNAEFHLGNYLGGIQPMVELQRKYKKTHQINMFIPDLHSFTTPVDHKKLYAQTMKNLRVFVAAGLDLEDPHTFIYRQSFIPAHSELTVILNNFAYFGELSRMTQFKEKSEAAKDQQVTAGLFDYPVLMAADILLYGAHYVPVGDDQEQHLEISRDIGTRLNNKFGKLFDIPYEWKKQMEFAKLDRGIRIRSLRHPTKKMSKSVDDPAGTILLSDKPEDAADKVAAATTDSKTSIRYSFNDQPGVSNLIQILALLDGQPLEEAGKMWQDSGSSYAELKAATAKVVEDFLEDFQEKLDEVDEAAILSKLEFSEKAMSVVADATLLKVQKAVGLRPHDA